ncbi:MAG: M48 family metallopeptidase [Micropepsaceae bacterium]
MINRWATIIATVVLCAYAASASHAANFDSIEATNAYLATVTGEAREKSNAYFEGGYWIILYNGLASIAAALILLFSGASSAMRDLAESMSSWRWLQTFIYAVLFILLTSTMTFPLTLYTDFAREHAFGLSNLSMQDWLKEYAIGLSVSSIMTGFFIVGLYGVIRRTGESWWLWATAVAVGFAMFGAVISPVFISPLFNEYKPMRDGQLKEEILAMARANGVPADNVYEFDASKQSTRISANVSGFLGTTRISLNDNLLNRATPAEVKAVMAHEIGHYALGHIYEMMVTITLIAAVAFLFIDFGFGMFHGLFGAWWGVRDFGDTAGLPILVLVSSLFGMLVTPVTNSMIRTNEAEADIFGLNAAREPDGFATISLKLAEYRKLEPTPWEEFIFYDHPSGRARILMSMRWKAEHLSDPSLVSLSEQGSASPFDSASGASVFADPPPLTEPVLSQAQQ